MKSVQRHSGRAWRVPSTTPMKNFKPAGDAAIVLQTGHVRFAWEWGDVSTHGIPGSRPDHDPMAQAADERHACGGGGPRRDQGLAALPVLLG